MAAVLGYDLGYTLWVKCDRCGEQLMAFGQGADGRPELEAMIQAEGWLHQGGEGWLCSRCAARGPIADGPQAERSAASDRSRD